MNNLIKSILYGLGIGALFIIWIVAAWGISEYTHPIVGIFFLISTLMGFVHYNTSK